MKFKRSNSKGNPEISTASLPDIVFILLFFFMVVTVIRKDDVLLRIELPKISESQELQSKDNVNHFYIGFPLEDNAQEPTIQFNDQFVSLNELEHIQYTNGFSEDQMINSLEVHKDVEMGLVSDLKTTLRKNNLLTVNYIALKEER